MSSLTPVASTSTTSAPFGTPAERVQLAVQAEVALAQLERDLQRLNRALAPSSTRGSTRWGRRNIRWAWAGLVALARAFRPRNRRPRLCLLAGTRQTRCETTRTLNRVLDELVGFQTRTPLDLVVVQDRIARSDGEPLRAAVQRTRRGSATLLTIRLALHANRTCYGPEAVAATLADVLVTLYEREAQASAVLEMPARVPREVPTGLPAVASTRNGTGSPPPATNGTGKPAAASTHNLNGMLLARAHANDEADGTVTQFKPRPGGPNNNDPA